MDMDTIKSKYAIEIGTKVMCPNRFEAYVIDRHVQSGHLVCEVSYIDEPEGYEHDTDIFYQWADKDTGLKDV